MMCKKKSLVFSSLFTYLIAPLINSEGINLTSSHCFTKLFDGKMVAVSVSSKGHSATQYSRSWSLNANTKCQWSAFSHEFPFSSPEIMNGNH